MGAIVGGVCGVAVVAILAFLYYKLRTRDLKIFTTSMDDDSVPQIQSVGQILVSPTSPAGGDGGRLDNGSPQMQSVAQTLAGPSPPEGRDGGRLGNPEEERIVAGARLGVGKNVLGV